MKKQYDFDVRLVALGRVTPEQLGIDSGKYEPGTLAAVFKATCEDQGVFISPEKSKYNLTYFNYVIDPARNPITDGDHTSTPLIPQARVSRPKDVKGYQLRLTRFFSSDDTTTIFVMSEGLEGIKPMRPSPAPEASKKEVYFAERPASAYALTVTNKGEIAIDYIAVKAAKEGQLYLVERQVEFLISGIEEMATLKGAALKAMLEKKVKEGVSDGEKRFVDAIVFAFSLLRRPKDQRRIAPVEKKARKPKGTSQAAGENSTPSITALPDGNTETAAA